MTPAPHCFWLLPCMVRATWRATGLYAIGFADGRVKFGKSRSPRGRTQHYWRTFGDAITWVHYFGRVQDAYSSKGMQCPAEIEACRMASEVGKRIGRSESFTGLTKAQALAIGRAARSADLAVRCAMSAPVTTRRETAVS